MDPTGRVRYDWQVIQFKNEYDWYGELMWIQPLKDTTSCNGAGVTVGGGIGAGGQDYLNAGVIMAWPENPALPRKGSLSEARLQNW